MRLTKERVAARLQGRFFLRIHMSLILGGTFLAGLAATKLLMQFGVNALALRYALAVAVSYLVFLLLIRLWLYYVHEDHDGIDHPDLVVDGAHDLVRSVDVGRSSSPQGFSGGDLSLDGDEWLVILLFLALVATLLVIGVYIIYTAPALLSEAAFEAILAASLLKKARKVESRGWVGAVWRATVWPLIAVLVLSAAFGWAVQRYCPEARQLRDVFHCPRVSTPSL